MTRDAVSTPALHAAPPPCAPEPTMAEIYSRFLQTWRVCPRTACRRAGACRGDADRCFAGNFARLPEGVRMWAHGLDRHQAAGVPFDDAMAHLAGSRAGDALCDWLGISRAALAVMFARRADEPPAAAAPPRTAPRPRNRS